MIRTVVFGGWAAITVFAFWRFDGRYRLPVPAQPATQPSIASTLAVPGAKATLVAFYTPGCPCSAFAMGDVASMARTFGPKGLAVKVVVEGEGDGPKGYPSVRDAGALAKELGIPAAPAAVVLNERGETVYVGGFNVARFCNDKSTAYAEQAVQAVFDKRFPARQKSDFYGCAVSQGKP